MSKRTGWSREFDEPIVLPDGRQLVRLRDAATYVTALPKKEATLPEWQAAIEAIMLVVEHGGPQSQRRARVPDRKDHHWGRRKLKRDPVSLAL